MGANLEALARRERLGIKRGLDNIRALLAALDHPERAYAVVLIGGTNGKGSVGALLAGALRAGGHRVGWTTSPHLVSVTERIWLDGAAIAEPALEACLGEVYAAEVRAGVEATFFEVMVAAALLAFRQASVAVALVEVGLGGRWDATNATDPLVSVLTSVGLDHQAFLGDTVEAIAREKLCIGRPGRPLVLGPGLAAAAMRPLLEGEPVLIEAPGIPGAEPAWDHTRVGAHRLGLAGAHQVENLATAREVLRQLATRGFGVPEAAQWRAFAEARWPGRLWQVPGLPHVWMDGAHNPDGATVLATHVRSCGVRPRLLFGAMKDKDLAGVAAALLTLEPVAVHFVRGSGERYADAEALGAAWGRACEVWDVPRAAAFLRGASEGPPILVAGSLYLLGDLLSELGIQP